MRMQRSVFDITTAADGSFVDTGPPLEGAIMQVRYVPDGSTPLDTGGNLLLTMIGTGVVVADFDNIGVSAGAWTRIPKFPVADTGGALVAGLREYLVAAGDSLRLTVAEGGNVKKGKLYIWSGSR